MAFPCGFCPLTLRFFFLALRGFTFPLCFGLLSVRTLASFNEQRLDLINRCA
jgi:hypothetical protein